MRIALFVLLFGTLAAVGLTAAAERADDQQALKKYRLAFEPKKGATLRIQYALDMSWDDKEEAAKGKARTELTLVWTFQAKGAKLAGTARYDRVVFRAQAEKKAEAAALDIEWTAKDGYLKDDVKNTETEKASVAYEIKKKGVSLTIDRQARCDEGEGGMLLTSRQGLPGSALSGFCATLPGKEVAVGETWTWSGELLRFLVERNKDLTATFTLKEVAQFDGEQCAHITGEVRGWSTPGVKCTVEMWYSLARGLPMKGTLVIEGKHFTRKIETKLLPEKPEGPDER